MVITTALMEHSSTRRAPLEKMFVVKRWYLRVSHGDRSLLIGSLGQSEHRFLQELVALVSFSFMLCPVAPLVANESSRSWRWGWRSSSLC